MNEPTPLHTISLWCSFLSTFPVYYWKEIFSFLCLSLISSSPSLVRFPFGSVFNVLVCSVNKFRTRDQTKNQETWQWQIISMNNILKTYTHRNERQRDRASNASNNNKWTNGCCIKFLSCFNVSFRFRLSPKPNIRCCTACVHVFDEKLLCQNQSDEFECLPRCWIRFYALLFADKKTTNRNSRMKYWGSGVLRAVYFWSAAFFPVCVYL